MKKLLSLVLALITLLSVATVMAGATTADVAETSATYYVSNKPFESVANATIVGYLGDLDGDKNISILDATQVQLSLASIIALDGNAKLLSDTDQDGSTSILDTTAIQCYIAKIATAAKVACTLYTKTVAPSNNMFEQVKNYLIANGEYDSTLNWYTIYDSNFDSEISTGLIYEADDDEIYISCDSFADNKSVHAFFTVKHNKVDDDYNSILAYKYDENDEVVYDLFGEAVQVNSTDRKLKLISYDFITSTNITFAKAEPELHDLIAICFADIEKKSNGNITNLYQIFV